MIKITIPLQPITKKNSQRIMQNKKSGRRWIAPSERYKQYEAESGWFIKCKNAKINRPVNVKCLFYMKTRRKPDLNNLLEAATDTLVHYGVLVDDNANIVAAHDGSRVLYDKDNPRTEIYISDFVNEYVSDYVPENYDVFYLCNRKQCEKCSPECKHTQNIRFAANFELFGDKCFVEKENQIGG